MRVLLCHPGPDFSVHDVFTGWLEALRELGVQVAPYNLNDRLIFYSMALIDTGEKDEDGLPLVKPAMGAREAYLAAMQGLSHACYTMWPDVILFISGFFMQAAQFELMRQRGHKIVILHTESPYQDQEQMERGTMADLNLLNDPLNLEAWRGQGPAEYMPHAYRPSVHYPRKGPVVPDMASDLCFIGTAFKSRIEFFTAMNLRGVDVLLGGNDWGKTPEDSPLAPFVGTGLGQPDCVDNAQAAALYRQSKMGLNFYRREAEDTWTGDGWAIGPREIEMAACGLPFLRDPRPESDAVFPMLPSFEGPEDAAEKLRWWLRHDRERHAAAVGARVAIQDRTFRNNARRFLQLVEDL